MVACGWPESRTGRERSAEICLAETCVKTVLPGGIGLGLHPFRGLAVIEDFEAVRLPIDVAEFHTDAVDWMPERLDVLIDGNVIRGCLGPAQSPTQMMIAVSISGRLDRPVATPMPCPS